MKCSRCGKEFPDTELYCDRCGKAVFPEYMDEDDIWTYYKTDEELEAILKSEQGETIQEETIQEELETVSEKKEKFFEESQENIEEEDISEDEKNEEDDEKKNSLNIQEKKKRRKMILFILLFLLVCFGIGIILGMQRMKDLEKQEKEYYKESKKIEEAVFQRISPEEIDFL